MASQPSPAQVGPDQVGGGSKPDLALHVLECTSKLARPKRFELLTPRFVVWCSIQLSYGRATGRDRHNPRCQAFGPAANVTLPNEWQMEKQAARRENFCDRTTRPHRRLGAWMMPRAGTLRLDKCCAGAWSDCGLSEPVTRFHCVLAAFMRTPDRSIRLQSALRQGGASPSGLRRA
jgi:hypothetical protein